jgi:hypothetical protein
MFLEIWWIYIINPFSNLVNRGLFFQQKSLNVLEFSGWTNLKILLGGKISIQYFVKTILEEKHYSLKNIILQK